MTVRTFIGYIVIYKDGGIMKLYINTLGDFDMIMNNESLLQDASRSYRLFKLLQYFLTFKNKKLLPETIIENLWQDQDSQDPKNMIRGQIFRLRQILKKILPDETYLNITFNNGYYTLEVGEEVVLDFEQMERWISEGDIVSSTDASESIKAYLRAIDIYKGGYLSENQYEIWLVPVRNYYKRIYIKTLEKLISLYQQFDNNEEIVQLCEKAITIEPYEEKIHILLIESLLKLGRIKNAYNHFEFMQIAFEKEMGITTTSAMREIQRKIHNYSVEKGEVDIQQLFSKLDEKDKKGPLLCESEYFKLLYNSHKRRRVDGNDSDYIALINFKPFDDNDTSTEVAIKLMTKVMDSTLRKGDVYTFWNDSQILLLLPEVKDGGVKEIDKRIKKNYEKLKNLDLRLSCSFETVQNENKLNIKDQSARG